MLKFLLIITGFALSAGPAVGDILSVPYDQIARETDDRITFEILPQHREPGFNLNAGLRAPGAWIAERFAGQIIAASATGHDALVGVQAARPLRLLPGKPGQNLSVALHRGFGSNAVLPLGPNGFGNISGRGEGALAILFDHDQSKIGLRIHTGYDDPLGTGPPAGRVDIFFFARSGKMIQHHILSPGPSISSHGFARQGDISDIAGIVVTNTDPGGIALDDILFQIAPLLF